MRGISALLVLTSVGLTALPARAQGAHSATHADVVVVMVGGDDVPERREAFRTHIERAARALGMTDVGELETHARDRATALGSLDVERVNAFREVERLLVSARIDAAAFQEDRALASLAEAVQRVERRADVPGAAAWIAEVYTAMGITAAQGGLDDLMEISLAKAATLDSSRGVRAAEAPPTVVERAASIVAAVATRPLGSFEVTCDARGARVFLDDRDEGTLPRIVRAPVGTHLLRVEAPGQRPWGSVIDVLEGRRPTVAIQLAPDPLVVAAQRLVAAGREADLAQVEAQRARLGLQSAWVVFIGSGVQDRALLVRCSEGRCDGPDRLELDDVPFVLPGRDAEHAIAAISTAGRGWLGATPITPPTPPPEWWESWYVWAGAGAVVAAAVITIIVLTLPGDSIRQHDVDIILPPSLGMGR